MSVTSDPLVRERWWHKLDWGTLQTLGFLIGWIVGVPAGALAAIAWGLWSNQASYAAQEMKYDKVMASNTALGVRIDAVEKIIEVWSKERAVNLLAVNSRLTKLETEVSPVIVTSDVIEKYGSHLGALDGRADTLDRNLLYEQRERADQISRLCAKLVGIMGASGKKSLSCP